MKFFLKIVLGISLIPSLLQPLFGISPSTIDLSIESRQLIVRCQFEFETNTLTLTLPPRSRLLRLNSPSNPQIQITNIGSHIEISDIQTNRLKKINLSYSITLSHPDFSIEKWYPKLSLQSKVLIRMHAPAGYTALVLPYNKMTPDGYRINLMEHPILINAKFKRENFTNNNISYTLYYPFKWSSSPKTLFNSYNAFSALLGKLPQTNLILIHLPNLSDQIFTNASQIVTMIPATDDDSLKRSLSLLWLKNLWHLDSNLEFALSDLLKRLFDNNGNLQPNDSRFLLVPRYSYYQKILKEGFEGSTLVQTDFNAMTKNFAMLHFAYYTLGLTNFTKGLKHFAEISNHNLTEFEISFLSNTIGKNADVIRYVCKNLLPVSSFIPDLALKENYLYRNNNSIPNIMIQVNTNMNEVNWGNRRFVDLGHLNGFTFVDPGSQIPQLNFFNDKTETEPSKKKERNQIYQAVLQHHQLNGEKFRSLYNMEHFNAPPQNPWNLPEGQTVYVAIVKIISPIYGRLRSGVKELILTTSDGTNQTTPHVIATRIRF